MKIFTITLNPAYDIHYTIENFRPYAENYVSSAKTDCGGKGINISSLLNTLGTANTPYVIIGIENGEAFEAFLKNNMPGAKVFRTDGRIRENITLHSPGSDETRISFSTFSLNHDLFENVTHSLLEEATEGSIVAFAGRIPEGIKKEEVILFLKALRENGVYTVVDSNSFTLSDYSEIKPWFIKPNEQEAGGFFTINSREDALSAAVEIRKSGVDNVMISLGGDGCAFASDTLCEIFDAPKTQVRSTIGAGDSTVAGFISAFSQNKSLDECVRYALICGSAACTTDGTTPPSKDVIDAFNSAG